MATNLSVSTPFDFINFGHWFASGITAVKSGLKFVEEKVGPTVQKVVEGAEPVTALAAASNVPYASAVLLFERGIDSAAGALLAAVHTAGAFDPSSPVVTLKVGIDTFNEMKQFIEDQKANLASLGYKL